MESSAAPNTTDAPEIPSSATSATPACEACRKLKMRCLRLNAADPCERCRRNSRACVIPKPRPLGRKHGSVGKYHGVEKAMRKMKSELRKAQASGDRGSSTPALPELSSEDGLLALFHAAAASPKVPKSAHIPKDTPAFTASDEFANSFPAETFEDSLSELPGTTAQANSAGPVGARVRSESHLLSALPGGSMSRSAEQHMESPRLNARSSRRSEESISNPLGLVADASGEAQAHEKQLVATSASPNSTTSILGVANNPEPQSIAWQLLRRPGYISLGLKASRQSLEAGLDALFSHPGLSDHWSNYFKPVDATRPPDVGPDVDPVDLGLVTMDEAHYLFPMFVRSHPTAKL
ncbi:unnamed protein product [Clonostachys rhizophaga]|uniref:Zn(2)-C6 fungal-type domain-containing protein n=1 Tax=Clonostachys rhizophaga TaxID=160324 RepID=A0A9N9V7K3_9HYPO|nr:unnamed protein product [Clonostachys rhizophaga]